MAIPIVYLCFANDQGQSLRLDEECEQIRAVFAVLERQKLVEVIYRRMIETQDLIDDLIKYKDRLLVVHFAGHAVQKGLLIEGNVVGTGGITQLLKNAKRLQLVFLNACSTTWQLEHFVAIKVPVVLFTNQEINDSDAFFFAKQFYYQFASGSSIYESFMNSRASLETHNKVRSERVELSFRHLESIQSNLEKRIGDWGIIFQSKRKMAFSLAVGRRLNYYLGAFFFIVIIFITLLFSLRNFNSDANLFGGNDGVKPLFSSRDLVHVAILNLLNPSNTAESSALQSAIPLYAREYLSDSFRPKGFAEFAYSSDNDPEMGNDGWLIETFGTGPMDRRANIVVAGTIDSSQNVHNIHITVYDIDSLSQPSNLENPYMRLKRAIVPINTSAKHDIEFFMGENFGCIGDLLSAIIIQKHGDRNQKIKTLRSLKSSVGCLEGNTNLATAYENLAVLDYELFPESDSAVEYIKKAQKFRFDKDRHVLAIQIFKANGNSKDVKDYFEDNKDQIEELPILNSFDSILAIIGWADPKRLNTGKLTNAMLDGKSYPLMIVGGKYWMEGNYNADSGRLGVVPEEGGSFYLRSNIEGVLDGKWRLPSFEEFDLFIKDYLKKKGSVSEFLVGQFSEDGKQLENIGSMGFYAIKDPNAYAIVKKDRLGKISVVPGTLSERAVLAKYIYEPN